MTFNSKRLLVAAGVDVGYYGDEVASGNCHNASGRLV